MKTKEQLAYEAKLIIQNLALELCYDAFITEGNKDDAKNNQEYNGKTKQQRERAAGCRPSDR